MKYIGHWGQNCELHPQSRPNFRCAPQPTPPATQFFVKCLFCPNRSLDLPNRVEGIFVNITRAAQTPSYSWPNPLLKSSPPNPLSPNPSRSIPHPKSPPPARRRHSVGRRQGLGDGNDKGKGDGDIHLPSSMPRRKVLARKKKLASKFHLPSSGR